MTFLRACRRRSEKKLFVVVTLRTFEGLQYDRRLLTLLRASD